MNTDMDIKPDAFYLVTTDIGDLILVTQIKMDGYVDVWKCLIHNKPRHNIIHVKKKWFVKYLGDNLVSSLEKHPEYFI